MVAAQQQHAMPHQISTHKPHPASNRVVASESRLPGMLHKVTQSRSIFGTDGSTTYGNPKDVLVPPRNAG